MESNIQYQFRGHTYKAIVYLSLQEDGCFIFCSPQDKAIILEFGHEIDIKTDCEKVIQLRITNDKLLEIKTAILDACKKLPAFIAFVQKSKSGTLQ